jgi:hypothetical protein
MKTTSVRSFSAIADLLRRAKQRDEEDDEPTQADDEERDDLGADRLPRKRKQKAKPDKDEEEDEEPGKPDGPALTPRQVTETAAAMFTLVPCAAARPAIRIRRRSSPKRHGMPARRPTPRRCRIPPPWQLRSWRQRRRRGRRRERQWP